MLPNSSVYQFLHLKSRSNKNLYLEVLGRLHQVTHRALICKYSNDSFPLNLSILHVAKGVHVSRCSEKCLHIGKA